jgi:hypothetical protein
MPVEKQKILEHFSGSDMSDSFHETIAEHSGDKLTSRELKISEIFFFAGAATFLDLQNKAMKVADHVGTSDSEKEELYVVACRQLQREIVTHGQEMLVDTLLTILRKLDQ